MIPARKLIGDHHLLLMTLDTLRFDVAESAMSAGQTPEFANWIPDGRWQLRHSPATFTWAAHHAFFSGFLPTPPTPGPHPRLFAAQFAGSETTTEDTFVFAGPDLMTGLAAEGYHTICVGGVGFFNQQTPLGCVLPNMFHESHWSTELGVTEKHSTERQFATAIDSVRRAVTSDPEQKIMLFINVSAMHQPNCHYVEGASQDSPDTQRAALAYVDSCLPALKEAMKSVGNWMCVICSDHGAAYGEEGHVGHRLAHPVVWNVPYAEFVFPGATS